MPGFFAKKLSRSIALTASWVSNWAGLPKRELDSGLGFCGVRDLKTCEHSLCRASFTSTLLRWLGVRRREMTPPKDPVTCKGALLEGRCRQRVDTGQHGKLVSTGGQVMLCSKSRAYTAAV